MSISVPIFRAVSINTDNLLQPLWLGKIDWSLGIPTSPEKYKSERDKIFDYWGEYKPTFWDDMYEYRKSFSRSNHNSFDNYESKINLQDKENQFITISKNKKPIKTNQQNNISTKFSSNPSNPRNDIDSEQSDSENNNFYYNDANDDTYDANAKRNYDYREDNF